MWFDIFITDSEKKSTEKSAPGLGYKLIFNYVRFFHNKIYYKKIHSVNSESIPQNCPLMIVSNHQNSLCDPLGLLMSIKGRKERKIKLITRADAFKNATANKILRYLGLLPAYRLDKDGADTLLNNVDTFNEVEDELLNNGTVIIFPEGKHQDKRWLGKFSYGYLRILFQAAEKSNFQKEMFVLPSCNHYSDYFNIQGELVIKYGTPISLAPYYELYKTKPRTAQRIVNSLVRQQVEDLMLNITDLDNYEAIDYLRETYGVKYAKDHNINPENIIEKQLIDKQLFTKLDELKHNNEDSINEIYNKVNILKGKEKEINIKEDNFSKRTSWIKLFGEGLLYLVFFPLFLISLIPNALILYPSKHINTKVKDPMMRNAVRIIVSLGFTIPVFYLITFLILWYIRQSFFIAIIYLICLPFLGIFAWNYSKSWKSWRRQLHYNRLLKKGKIDEIKDLRADIYESLDKLLK